MTKDHGIYHHVQSVRSMACLSTAVPCGVTDQADLDRLTPNEKVFSLHVLRHSSALTIDHFLMHISEATSVCALR